MTFYMIVLCIQLILFLFGCTYTNAIIEHIDKRQYKLHFLMPAVAFWLNKFHYFKKESVQRKLDEYKMLHPGEDVQEKFYLKWYYRFSIIYVLFFGLSILCLLLKCSSNVIQLDEYMIRRPDIGMVSKSEKFTVILTEENQIFKDDIILNIQSREYTKSELNQLRKEAEEFVVSRMRANNSSLDTVKTKLNLLTDIPNNPYKVSWLLNGQTLINEDGTLNNKALVEKSNVVIKMCLAYQQNEVYIEVPIGVMPYEWTWEERAKEGFLELVEQIDSESERKEEFQLPNQVGDMDITYEVRSEDKSFKLLLFVSIGIIVVWGYWEEEQKKKTKKRKQECQLLYPDVVYKLTLLLGAGMTLKGAWKRLVMDYLKEKNKKSDLFLYTYEEMLVTWNEMESGIGEVEAIERFGKRMKLKRYLRLSSLVSQNMKKGTKGFLQQLEVEVKEAQEERKQLARKLGEEAGTKLLFPMLIMLVIVFVIVMMPAFLSFSKGGL